LFAIVALIVIYSILGYTAVWSDGTTEAIRLTPLQSIQVGVDYIGAVVSAVIGLFNPQTAGDTISNSTSVIGIAALSVEYFTSGVQDALLFMAMISVSLGIMNLLPIPPLDGGRFLVELIQKISRRTVPERLVNYVSVAATAAFALLFVVMANQDIQRFVFGNW
jgi:regulator of sigma E protease